MSGKRHPPLRQLSAGQGGTNLENTDYDLTHFTANMVRMVAWWRESWIVADGGNAVGFAMGMGAMLINCHSMRRNVGMVVHVLKYGHERWEEMATQIARAMAVQLTEDNLDEEDVEKILEMFGVEVEDDGQ